MPVVPVNRVEKDPIPGNVEMGAMENKLTIKALLKF